MSQVIVTNDNLKEKRQRSRDQELKISTEAQFQKWRRDDVTKPDAFQRVVGFLTYPIVGLWAMICGLIYVVVKVAKILLGFLGGGHNEPSQEKK